ncbi:MAG: NAD(P)-dependent oxidoreductase [Proteobacteria bacterium]|nr:NAD(P)-dependent oxidoreductase [Pseudomonadota bacterium]
MAKRVLITGGAGYLGSILCEHLLDAGYCVTALDNLMYGQKSLFHLMANPNLDYVFGDTRDEELMKRLVPKADVIIPLAAVVGAPACARDPWLAESVNNGVRLVLDLSSANQLIVYPTTNSGYGTKSGDVYCTEETPLEPISKYGVDKVQLEQDVLNNQNAITLRLATVFGLSPRLRMDLLVNHFTWMAVSDSTLVIFEKDFKRNYIHVRDVADCFIHCIENSDGMTGRPFNAGLDAANLSKEELALKIKEYVPNFYIHFAEVGSDPDKRNYIVSNQCLREAGFEATRSLEQGIEELIKGYRMMVRMPFRNV